MAAWAVSACSSSSLLLWVFWASTAKDARDPRFLPANGESPQRLGDGTTRTSRLSWPAPATSGPRSSSAGKRGGRRRDGPAGLGPGADPQPGSRVRVGQRRVAVAVERETLALSVG